MDIINCSDTWHSQVGKGQTLFSSMQIASTKTDKKQQQDQFTGELLDTTVNRQLEIGLVSMGTEAHHS